VKNQLIEKKRLFDDLTVKLTVCIRKLIDFPHTLNYCPRHQSKVGDHRPPVPGKHVLPIYSPGFIEIDYCWEIKEVPIALLYNT
jgi:hypothetical protein